MKQLISFADVVITHFPPGVAEGLGLDYETLKKTNPRLIYASMSDFGSHGPLAEGRGSELAAQAMSAIWRFLGDMTSRGGEGGPRRAPQGRLLHRQRLGRHVPLPRCPSRAPLQEESWGWDRRSRRRSSAP